MNPSWRRILKRHCGRNLFEVKSRIKGAGTMTGYIVDFSEEFILFHQLEKDSFRLNGYSVLRNDDIKLFRAFSRREHWQHRAAKLLRLKPKRPPAISLDSLSSLLESIDKRYPLLVIHPEKKDPDVCFIGPLISISSKTFAIDDLDANCEWAGPRRIRLDDVTRIDFGGGYDLALAATAPARRKR